MKMTKHAKPNALPGLMLIGVAMCTLLAITLAVSDGIGYRTADRDTYACAPAEVAWPSFLSGQ